MSDGYAEDMFCSRDVVASKPSSSSKRFQQHPSEHKAKHCDQKQAKHVGICLSGDQEKIKRTHWRARDPKRAQLSKTRPKRFTAQIALEEHKASRSKATSKRTTAQPFKTWAEPKAGCSRKRTTRGPGCKH